LNNFDKSLTYAKYIINLHKHKNYILNLRLKIYLILTFTIILQYFSGVVIAQLPTQQWVAQYNGVNNGHESAVDMAMDSTGNIYVTGRDGDVPEGFVTIKYNPAGVQQWATRYTLVSTIIPIPVKIAVDRNGNVYVIAYDYECILVKYNNNGIQQWVRRYHGPMGTGGDNAFKDIAIDSANNIYVTGKSRVTNLVGDLVTLKYDPAGVLIWVKSYNRVSGDTGGAGGKSIVIDKQHNIIVTGNQETSNGSNVLTIKYNINGDSLWNREYKSVYNRNDEGYIVRTDSQNNIYVAGHTERTISDNLIVTLKYTESGVFQWNSFYHGPAPDSVTGTTINIPHDMIVDGLGNVIVTGESTTPETDYDYATIKYNTNGVELWAQRFTSPGYNSDFPRSLAMDNMGSLYVTGEFYTVKYNNFGILQWSMHNPGFTYPYAGAKIIVDDSYDVFIASTATITNNYDIFTVKYSQTVGIHNITNELPQKYELKQNYPNPFNPVTKISFGIPRSGIVKIKIYDVSGSIISVLHNKYLTTGAYSIDFDGSNYSSGIYFYTLESDHFKETKKMILLK